MPIFVSNFVAMATEVGSGRICVTSCNSPCPKTPCWTQRSPRYLVYKRSYSRFCLEFRCHGNLGRSLKTSLTSLDSLIPKSDAKCTNIGDMFLYKPSYSYFFLKFLKFRCLRLLPVQLQVTCKSAAVTLYSSRKTFT